jgi:caffeoyl-CoA O-methyltransferase
MAANPAVPWLDPAIAQYVYDHTAAPDDVLRDLRAETAERLGEDDANMQVSADQGALLTLLTGFTGAERAVEVGTFTGYSAICIARALRPGGRLLCCDVSERYTAIARRAWARAGLTDRIELRIAPAIETLRALPEEEHVDVAFIDADKASYADYWDELVPRVRRGGLLLVDNTLWSGTVVDPLNSGNETAPVITAFNDKVTADDRVASYILPISDGLTIARKL